jgi:hypothetical protein
MARSGQCTVVNQVAGFVAEGKGNRLYKIMVVFELLDGFEADPAAFRSAATQ